MFTRFLATAARAYWILITALTILCVVNAAIAVGLAWLGLPPLELR